MKKVYYSILQPREYEKNSFVANTPPSATAALAHPTNPMPLFLLNLIFLIYGGLIWWKKRN